MKALSTLYYIIPLLTLYFSMEKVNIFSPFKTNDWHQNPAGIVKIIQRYTGVCETHHLQTDDGYILTMFQIPRRNPKGVILLQHPIFFDSRIWVSQYNNSIAFLFWNAGYEVWLGNTRGNFFSKKHTNLSSTDPAFWNFTFHEMGYYDNHATIEYIKRNTSQSKIIFVGYSMGGTSGFVYASTRPEDASRSVKVIITMAAVTHLSRGTSFSKYIVPPFFFLQRNLKFVDAYFTVLRYDSWYLRLVRSLFAAFPCRKCIIYANGLISGWTPDELDPDLVDELMQVFGSEVPLKMFDHYNQIYISGGEFRMYDYGERENVHLYGTKKPPWYPLEDIKVPIFLMYGQNDSFICPKDNEYLYGLLPRNSAYGKLSVEGFNHADFGFGRHRIEKVYKQILTVLENFEE